jgi:hypothetical protein
VRGFPVFSPRARRILAISYLVKTALVAFLWDAMFNP